MIRKLATSLARLNRTSVDMCVNSCIAFTGAYKDLTHCPWRRKDDDGKLRVCGEARFLPGTKTAR